MRISAFFATLYLFCEYNLTLSSFASCQFAIVASPPKFAGTECALLRLLSQQKPACYKNIKRVKFLSSLIKFDVTVA